MNRLEHEPTRTEPTAEELTQAFREWDRAVEERHARGRAVLRAALGLAPDQCVPRTALDAFEKHALGRWTVLARALYDADPRMHPTELDDRALDSAFEEAARVIARTSIMRAPRGPSLRPHFTLRHARARASRRASQTARPGGPPGSSPGPSPDDDSPEPPADLTGDGGAAA